MTYDVVTFGETMLQLLSPGDLRIEQTTSFDIHAAGSESNTAVALARLGATVNWFSRLPSSSMGKLIANRIRAEGVHTPDVIWAEQERLGLCFVEKGIYPRPTEVIYDRKQSAMSAIQPDDLPELLFHRNQARLLHTTGITVALSDSAAKTVAKAFDLAKAAGWLVSFDVNYRSKLWSSADASQKCAPFLEQANIIFIPLRDAQGLFEYSSAMTIDDILNDLHRQYPDAIIVMSQGESGSMCCSPSGEVFSQPAFAVDGAYRIGAGDAFSAGFLYCYLCHTANLKTALRWGNASAAIKFSIPGDLPLIDKQHIETLVSDTSKSDLLR
ncbi:MAG: PfkB family carbohydrate kinase [Aggregatilineales bacterium]